MSQQTVRDKIQSHLIQLESGVPILHRQLKGFGSNSATQKALRSLCEEGSLVRVMKGYYVRPKKLTSIPSIAVTCTPKDIAKLWAKEKGYILTSTSFEEAYRLRFQTQMPVKTQFWTDGPNKVFTVGKATVSVKHVAASKLLWHDLPLGRLYRAMQVLKPEYTSEPDLKQVLKKLCTSDQEIDESMALLSSEPLLKKWHPKLQVA